MRMVDDFKAQSDRNLALLDAYVILACAKEFAMESDGVDITDYYTITHALRHIENLLGFYPYQVQMTIFRYKQMTKGDK